MAFEPKAGLVIRFDFLWKHEADKGQLDGSKDRPCAIILTTKAKEDGKRDVMLCPITHTPPSKDETAVEIPHKLARHLKLDDERMWIKTDQLNTVEWPDNMLPFGVTPAFKGQNQSVFGQLHSDIGKQAFEQVRENARNRKLDTVRREMDIDDVFSRIEKDKDRRYKDRER